MTPDTIQFIDPYRRSLGRSQPSLEKSFTFEDALDVINPLQHIPVVGWLYREISGDTMSTPAAIAGGALFGGPVGFAGAVLSAAIESLAGEPPETALSDLFSPARTMKGLAAYGHAAGLANS